MNVNRISIVLAIVYRELALFRRNFSEFLAIWLIPIVFSLSIIFLPMSVFSSEAVIHRIEYILETPKRLSLKDVLVYIFTLSAIISLVVAVINDIVQSIHQERHGLEVLQTVLESSSLKSYIIVSSIIKSILVGFLSTIYLAITLCIVMGFNGVLLYIVLALPLMVSAIALGLYSTIIAIPITFYIRVDRPWTIANTLVPALLVGSGLYIPLYLVPLIIKLLAYSSPIPELCELMRLLVFTYLSPKVYLFMVLISMLLLLYLLVTHMFMHITELRVKRYG